MSLLIDLPIYLLPPVIHVLLIPDMVSKCEIIVDFYRSFNIHGLESCFPKVGSVIDMTQPR